MLAVSTRILCSSAGRRLLKSASSEVQRPKSDYILHRRIFPAHQPIKLYNGYPNSRDWKQELRNALLTVFRALELGVRFSPCLLSAPFLWITEFRSYWYRLFAFTLQRCGPVFVKFGQWLGTRPDLFGQELCNILSTLQVRVEVAAPQRNIEQLTRIYEAELDSIFDFFDYSPVASGCVAQVHKARLSLDYCMKLGIEHSKRDVAVKIRRFGIEKSFSRDVQLLSLGSNMLGLIGCVYWMSIPEACQEFCRFMDSQLDLRVEAENLIDFRTCFKKNGSIRFPEPILSLCEAAVLVETWEDGVSLRSLLQTLQHSDKSKESTYADLPMNVNKEGFIMEGSKHDTMARHDNNNNNNTSIDVDKSGKRIAKIALDAFVDMVMVHNLIHADLHPGNVLVRHKSDSKAFRQKEKKLRQENGAFGELYLLKKRITNRVCSTLSSAKSNFNSLKTKLFDNNNSTETSNSEVNKSSKESVMKYNPRDLEIVLLDVGLVLKLSTKDRANLLDFLSAVLDRNGEKVAQLFLERSSHQQCEHPDVFANELNYLIDHFLPKAGKKLCDFRSAEVVMELLQLAFKHKIKLDPIFVNLFLSVGVIEGVGRQLYPDMNIVTYAIPVMMLKRSEMASSLFKVFRRHIVSILKGCITNSSNANEE